MSDYTEGRETAFALLGEMLREQINSQAALAHQQAEEFARAVLATLREEVRIAYRQGFIDAIAMAYREGLAKTRIAADAMQRHQPPTKVRRIRAKSTHGDHPSGPAPLRPVS